MDGKPGSNSRLRLVGDMLLGLRDAIVIANGHEGVERSSLGVAGQNSVQVLTLHFVMANIRIARALTTEASLVSIHCHVLRFGLPVFRFTQDVSFSYLLRSFVHATVVRSVGNRANRFNIPQQDQEIALRKGHRSLRVKPRWRVPVHLRGFRFSSRTGRRRLRLELAYRSLLP